MRSTFYLSDAHVVRSSTLLLYALGKKATLPEVVPDPQSIEKDKRELTVWEVLPQEFIPLLAIPLKQWCPVTFKFYRFHSVKGKLSFLNEFYLPKAKSIYMSFAVHTWAIEARFLRVDKQFSRAPKCLFLQVEKDFHYQGKGDSL